MKILCNYCKNEFTSAFLTLPTCGYLVCKEHLDNLPGETIDCIVCSDHSINLKECFSMKRNKEVLHEIETNKEIKVLEENLSRFEKIKSDPEFYITESFENIITKIDLRREELKESTCKLIDIYSESLMKTIHDFKQNRLERLKHTLKNTQIEALEGLNLEKINQINKKLEKIENIIKWSLEFDLENPRDDLVIENLFGKLKYPGKEKFSEIFEGKCEKTFQIHESKYVNNVQMLASKTVVSCSSDCTLRVLNIETGEVLKTFRHKDQLIDFLICEDRLISASSDSTIQIWNLDSGKLEKTLEGHSNWIFCLEILDTNLIASGSSDNLIKIWNINSGECVKNLTGHTKTVKCLIKRDSKELLSGSLDYTIRMWDLNRSVCVKILKGHSGEVRCLRYLKNGNLLSGSGDCTIKIWDLEKEVCLKSLSGHLGLVYDIFVLEDQEEIISCSRDTTIKLWNLSESKCLMTFQAHDNDVNVVTLIPSGEILSCGDDFKIKIWS